MASAIDNAVTLYFAVNGWGDPIRCQYTSNDLTMCGSSDVVGIADDDGCPLCQKHLNCEDGTGQLFAPGVLEALKAKQRSYQSQEAADAIRTRAVERRTMTPQAELFIAELKVVVQKHIDAGMPEGDVLGVWFGSAVGASLARNVDPAELHKVIDMLVAKPRLESLVTH